MLELENELKLSAIKASDGHLFTCLAFSVMVTLIIDINQS